MIGDWIVSCPTRRAVRYLALNSHDHPAYIYYFNQTPTFTVNEGSTKWLGAFHGADVPFFWNDVWELDTQIELNISSIMSIYITNFAWSGDPNSRGKSPLGVKVQSIL